MPHGRAGREYPGFLDNQTPEDLAQGVERFIAVDALDAQPSH
jgi:hypothetical protein